MTKFTFTCASLFMLLGSSSVGWAASPVDVCKGPITYVEIATAGGKYPTDPIKPDGGTDGFPTWSPALNLKNSKASVFCTANPGDDDVINPLPANVESCKVVASKTKGKKTMLCS